MTAEIVIINQQAVALAADSALTIGKQRVWKHANKLFSAGPQHDIGIMIYNSGDFLSIPWEIIIKEFRKSISNLEFSTVADFARSFVDYTTRDEFGSENFEELSFGLIFNDIIEHVKEDLEFENKSQYQQDLLSTINDQLEELQTVAELQCSFEYSRFKSHYKTLIVGLARKTLKRKMNKFFQEKFVELCFEHIRRESSSEYSTGIVIAGYGRSELFPSVKNVYVDGRSLGFTRVWISEPQIDLNKSRSANAAIMPFAQIDMAKLFMEGISEKYVEFTIDTLGLALEAKAHEIIDTLVADQHVQNVEKKLQEKQIASMVTTFQREFRNYRNEYFTKPILDTIQALPKEEMAYMARAMVEITALRRRFASTVETVGGDIDVAVISKSDGFIWIHRKHYFDIDANPDFMQRRQSIHGG